jgi:hypothetical protein
MLAELVASPFLIAAIVLVLIGAMVTISGLVALLRLRLMGFAVRILIGVVLLSLGGVAGAVGVGIQGYRALTREDVAARVSVKPLGNQRIDALVRFPDGREARYQVAGDEIYFDAQILKWKPAANLLGLHTAYELSRLTGRYTDIEQEKKAPRTVYSLAQTRPVDLFSLRRRYAFLESVLDADYGSGTFVPVTRPAELEVRVSTSGLLLREVGSPKS